MEAQAFLVEFARAVQRWGMYPAGHPAVVSMAESVTAQAGEYLAAHPSLSIRIDSNHLTVEDVETDPEQALFRGLSRRLYRHFLYNLTFERGLQATELTDFISAVSVSPGPLAEPLGNAGKDLDGRWPHIRIELIPFESLALARECPEDDDTYWAGEAESQAALAQAQQQLADLNLPKLSEVLRGADTSDPGALHEGISRLVLDMEPGTLQRLMLSLPDSYRRSAAQTAVEQSIQEIIEAADEGQGGNASQALLRLLVKLALLTETDEECPETDEESDAMLAALLQRMGSGWDIEDPNPQEYEETLRSFDRTAREFAGDIEWEDDPDNERIVQISLEIDETAPPTLKATANLISGGRTGGLMDILDNSPENTTATEALWKRVDRRETVNHLLNYRPVDYPTLDRMIARIWLESAGPMLDSLLESESRSERFTLLELLSRIGPELGPLIVERLDDSRWYRTRNLLTLIGCLPDLPEGFSLVPYLEHSEPRVRREAFAIALNRAQGRVQAILRALDDDDHLVVERALESSRRSCPAEAVPFIITLIHNPDTYTRLRILGIRALAGSRSRQCYDALLSLVQVRKFLFWNGLAPKSAIMLEALAVISRSWRSEPQARSLLAEALRSPDSQIRAVARPPEDYS